MRNGLDVAVAGRQHLLPAVHHPHVGVTRAGVERGLHRELRDLEFTHAAEP